MCKLECGTDVTHAPREFARLGADKATEPLDWPVQPDRDRPELLCDHARFDSSSLTAYLPPTFDDPRCVSLR